MLPRVKAGDGISQQKKEKKEKCLYAQRRNFVQKGGGMGAWVKKENVLM